MGPVTRNQSRKLTLSDLTPSDIEIIKDALKKCDMAINDCEESRIAKDTLINQQNRIIAEQISLIENLKEDQNSFWNSHLLWATIGVVVVGSVALIAKGVVN